MDVDAASRYEPIYGTGAPFGLFREAGFLWLINAAVFHPRGWAIAFTYPDGADPEAIKRFEVEPTGWKLVGDGGERWTFSCDDETTQQCDELFTRTMVLLAPRTNTPEVGS